MKVACAECSDRASSSAHVIMYLTRAQPKKKKKVDVKREQAQKDRMKKKIKKLEKAAPELIPIEDFETPLKFSDNSR